LNVVKGKKGSACGEDGMVSEKNVLRGEVGRIVRTKSEWAAEKRRRERLKGKWPSKATSDEPLG